MKKIFTLSVMVIIIIMPLAGAINFTKSSKIIENTTIENLSNEENTHVVLAESISKTTCPYCPEASSQLHSIYNSHDHDFYYVTFVTDKISELPTLARSHLYDRLNELGVEYVPDVYFDGVYTHIQSKQDDEQPYRNAIIQSGERDVPDIDIDLDVDWIGAGNTIKVNIIVTNNEPEVYDSILRVYITEIESEWTDAQHNQYHFALLDIPLNANLAVIHQNYAKNQLHPLGNTYTFTKWWSGDITQDNCMVIATVFDKDTDYAVQTASATPSLSGSMSHPVLLSFFEKLPNSFPIIRNLFKLIS